MADPHPFIHEEALAQLPTQPGVYQFFGDNERLLYIGKATNLRSRVRSYFRHSTELSDAKRLMVSKIVSLHTTVVETPAEALLLETTLIKRHRPPYNVLMKDDKHFQYIHITDSTFPAIELIRRLPKPVQRHGLYFGPYISGRDVQIVLRLLQDVFGYCTHPPQDRAGRVVYPARPCLPYQLDRCVGPCAGAINAQDYRAVIDRIVHFLRGQYRKILDDLANQMQAAAQQSNFERAAVLRDQIQAIERLLAKQHVVFTQTDDADYLSLVHEAGQTAINVFMVRSGRLIQQYVVPLAHVADQSDHDIMTAVLDQYQIGVADPVSQIYTNTTPHRGRHRRLLEMGVENARQWLRQQVTLHEAAHRRAVTGLRELATYLQLTRPPQRIEIYDISHFQGAYTVGSMVVFEGGLPAPNQYRKFRVKSVAGIDDFASMREVLRRRIMHLPAKAPTARVSWPTPDLIIIDGGKGQLSAAVAMLQSAHTQLPIVSLAKREEEVFVPGNSVSIRLPHDSQALYLLQRMRDEAHRFAITFYRQRHQRSLREE